MSRRFGLLIGINDYAVNPLDYCINDVNKIAGVLVNNCQFNANDLRIITSDFNSSTKEIFSLLDNALESISKEFHQGEDALFFFFSGHGVHEEEATLLFHSQEIKVSTIYNAVEEKLNPKNQIFVFDACHSGEKIKSAEEEDFMTELYWNKLGSKAETKTIIAASRFDQKATEKSIFQNGTLTHYFLKAIDTIQNYNDLGFTTPTLIADYVRKEVSLDKNFKQIPYTSSVDIGSYPFAFSKYLQTGDKNGLTEPKITEKDKEKNTKEKTVIRTAPTVLFYERLSKAFPGVRGVKWFEGKAAVDGLTRFLYEPLRYDITEGYGVLADPIWWFRGGSALSVTKYRNLGDNKILLNNNDELIIDKIAVYNSSSYFSSFIYIETLPDRPSGVYDIETSVLERQVARRGFYSESFGIYNNRFITFEECQDGAAFIDGEYTELIDSQYRSRYLSKYNIILVPKSSPHNTNQGNLLGDQYMNSILRGEKTLEQFAEEYDLLPRNHMDQ